MALLGHLINRSLQIRKNFSIRTGTPRGYQQQVLKRLLKKAKHTHFGKHYQFNSLLKSEDLYQEFKKTIPYHNYNQMYSRWWKFCHEGESDVCWPGKVKYFALSSGTSDSASKHIPVTDDMIKSVKKAGFKQFYSMQNFDLPPDVFGKGILMLGGTTSLFEQGDYYEGDMSGISAKNMPRWLSFLFYKPGRSISKRPKWEDRIRLIVRKAPQWNVGTVCGVPAWVQIVFEQIIKYHKVNNIHDIWPNLSLYIHGGVSFEPYRETFKNLLGKKITFIETYMASEGSFGFQARPDTKGIRFILNNSIFYEFVPFNEDNFTEDGELLPNAHAYMINEVVENQKYAVILSTCAGAWRYLIGDVIQFTSVKLSEFIIVGRTKQFLSLCGEHLSVDNMNKAIDEVQRALNIGIKEFAVAGYAHEGHFAHKWYIGCDDYCNPEEVLQLIDQRLAKLNDDYAVERESALPYLFIEILPSAFFIEFLQATGKFGAMNKFPRVLKNSQLKEWQQFLTLKAGQPST
ncbi:MAG: GH3 auxin-responsive promoter family protein [Chitinophagaceae bacterium]|nr:GH3 auxin-responsive promoter family protein [Chitinophagaceae bacterium]